MESYIKTEISKQIEHVSIECRISDAIILSYFTVSRCVGFFLFFLSKAIIPEIQAFHQWWKNIMKIILVEFKNQEVHCQITYFLHQHWFKILFSFFFLTVKICVILWMVGYLVINQCERLNLTILVNAYPNLFGTS